MVQFNLLPDVKLTYIKSRQTKRLVLLIATGSAGITLSITVLLLIIVYGIQKGHLGNLNKDITTYSDQLKETPDLNKILTIQNQLSSLPALHDNKVVASRLFDYINKLTPNQASIGRLNIDFNTNIIAIEGTADNLSVINKFADTLKFTTFKTEGENSQSGSAFSEVVLSNFATSENKTNYKLDFKFDPIIFSSANSVKLTVPSIISTRSETEKPTDLFQKLETQTDQGGQ